MREWGGGENKERVRCGGENKERVIRYEAGCMSGNISFVRHFF